MIAQLRRYIFSVRYRYDDPISQQRAAGLLSVVSFLGSIASVWIIFLVGQLIIASETSTIETGSLIALIAVPLVCAGMWYLIQIGELELASWIFVLTMFLSNPSVTNRLDTSSTMGLFPGVIAAGLLLGRRGLALSLVLIIAFLVFGTFSQSQLTEPQLIVPSETLPINLALAATLYGLALFFMYFLSGNFSAIFESVDSALRKSRRAGQFVEEVFDTEEDEVYPAVTKFVTKELGFSHAYIYITEDDGHIEDRYDDAFGGRRLTVQNIGEGIVQAAETKQPVLTVREDAPHSQGYFVQSSQYAVAVPAIFQDRVLAVLDVQSFKTPFTENDIRALEVLASQVALAIEQARQLEGIRESLRNHEIAVENLREQLKSGRFTEASPITWRAIGETALTPGFDIDGDIQNIKVARDLPPEIQKALETEEMAIVPAGHMQQLLLPISLRGAIIGAMSFEIPANKPISERKIELAQNIVSRLAIALENKRLFEQSQALAVREQRASEVGNQLIGATDVDAVLELATKAFNDALNAAGTRIIIQPEAFAESETSQNGGGH